MIDDSLSDTQQWNKTFDMLVKDAAEIEQQEKKQMSVKELKLKTGDTELEIKKVGYCFALELCCSESGLELIYLDSSQAHLLMLYLQEHLGYVSISKDRLND